MTDTTLPSPLVPAEVELLAWHRYAQRKAEFLQSKPDATPDEVEKHCRQLAQEDGL